MHPRSSERKLPRVAVIKENALGCVVVSLLVVPYACYKAGTYIYSYCRYGKRPQRQRGCVRRRNDVRYTEQEWRRMKPRVNPEYLDMDVPEIPEAIEVRLKRHAREEEDRLLGIEPVPEQHKSVLIEKDMLQTWKAKGQFRFMDLPKEVQILTLEQVVVDTPGGKWSALAGFCKDGFVRYDEGVHAGQTQFIKPKGMVMRNTYALWRSNHTPTTRSLLLTSKDMHNLTNAVLASTFSGRFRFHARQRTSQLDTPWPWDSITSISPVIVRNRWLFDLVRIFETPHLLSVWTDVLSVMPNLEKISVTLPYVGGRFVCRGEHFSRGLANRNLLFLAGRPVSDVVVECGQNWIDWCRQRARDGQHTVPVSITVMRSCLCTRWRMDNVVTEVQLWPNVGLVLRDDHAVLLEHAQTGQILL